MLGIVAIYVLFVIVTSFIYRYSEIKKDVKSRKTKILNVELKELKILDDYGTKYYDLYFVPRIDGKGKVRFFEAHPYFNILRKGQKVMIIVSESAFYPLGIFPGGS